jgi:hypothetical protein
LIQYITKKTLAHTLNQPAQKLFLGLQSTSDIQTIPVIELPIWPVTEFDIQTTRLDRFVMNKIFFMTLFFKKPSTLVIIP